MNVDIRIPKKFWHEKKAVFMTNSKHTGIDWRNCFLPPQYRVHRLIAETDEAWDAIPPIPVLVAPDGDVLVQRDSELKLAWNETHLFVSADIHDAETVFSPDLTPDSPDFWRQDHIEFRLLPDPKRELEQIQFIISPSGKCFDNRGLWKEGIPYAKGSLGADGWRVRLAVPIEKLGLRKPRTGTVLKGILAHTRWADQFADIACSSATELGFTHADHFGEFVFVEENAFQLTNVTGCSAEIMNASGGAVKGSLLVTAERDTELPPLTRAYPVDLGIGRTQITVDLPVNRPLYTRFHMAFATTEGTTEFGAITFRAPVPDTPTIAGGNLEHPYLFLTADELEKIRAKKSNPFVSQLLSDVLDSNAPDRDIPDPDSDDISLKLTPDCAAWFRVAKETMLRDGKGGKKASAKYLWDRQSETAHRGWERVVEAVAPSEEELQVVLDELNRLLRQRDFYNRDAFGDLELPAEGEEVLERGIDQLSEEELFRFNRIVLTRSVECIHNFKAHLASKPGALFTRWLATDDDALIPLATKAVKAAVRFSIVGPYTDLHEGGASTQLAMAYDAFHPYLSEAEREAWITLMKRYLGLHQYTARRHHWNCVSIPNANPVCNAGGGLLALALWREAPELAAECLQHARRFIWHWLDYCAGPDGGNTEGAQYWQYGTENFIPFAIALERVTGSDDGLLSHPAIQNAMNMIEVGLSNDGSMHGMNDTIPVPVGGNLAWFIAGRYSNTKALWYGDHAYRISKARSEAGKKTPYRVGVRDLLLYRPNVPEQTEAPPWEQAFMLDSIQYSIIRSGTNYDCRWTAGLKGSRPPYTHHNQPDTGSFYIHLRGERLLIDPGYYKGNPTDHCLPLIGGRGPVQPEAYTGRITACRSCGDVRYVACDSTDAYDGAAERVVRHLVMVGDQGLVLLDDIVADQTVTAQYQCGGPTKALDDDTILIAGETARVRMDVCHQPRLKLTCHEERNLHDTHWGYHFADCRMFPVTGEYDANETEPLITIFSDATGDIPQTWTIDRRDREILVQTPRGDGVRFVKLNDGWQTDV